MKKQRKTKIINGQICSVRGVPLTRCNNTMTEREFVAYILSGLRRLTKYWKPKLSAMRESRRVYFGTDKRTKWVYVCEICTRVYKQKNIEVDHIVPCGGLAGIEDIPRWIELAFVEKGGYQVLCKECHLEVKTKKEREESRLTKSIRKLYPREESSYRNMMSRCNNPNSTGYEYYGGRGIKVCDYWQESFHNFYKDMGQRPDNTSLDRIDVNGDYNKSNCRWATHFEQARNTTSNNYLTYNNQTLCIEEWGALLEIKPNTLVYRLKRGWTVPQALGFEKKEKCIYNGRIAAEDILEIIRKYDNGITQIELGREYGIDASNISRLYHKFKGNEHLLTERLLQRIVDDNQEMGMYDNENPKE